MQFQKDLLYCLCTILLLTVFYLLPDIFGGQRDFSCEANIAKSYVLFAYGLISYLAIINLAWLIAYFCRTDQISSSSSEIGRMVLIASIAKLLANPIGFTVYFAWNLALWADLTSACFSGYNLMDFLVWLPIVLLTGVQAIFCLLTIICAPCVYRSLKDLDGNDGLFSSIIRSRYDANNFRS